MSDKKYKEFWVKNEPNKETWESVVATTNHWGANGVHLVEVNALTELQSERDFCYQQWRKGAEILESTRIKLGKSQSKLQALEEQNRMLVEKLKFYGDETNYYLIQGSSEIDDDQGETARQALASLKGEK